MPRKKKSATTAEKKQVVRAACPHCASLIALPAACLGVSLEPGEESAYFRRLRKSEHLILEMAGAVKSCLRAKKVLEQWLVDSGFVDSAL